MTNLLVQSVDTIDFYHFLSTEHNCVQITPSQGNSHKILLSIKINAMFYFWENEEEIGKAVQEKKNLGRTLFFGQSFGYSHCDDEAVIHPNLTPSCASHLFPSHPIEPKPFSALFQKSSVSDASCGSWAVCQQQGWQKPWGGQFSELRGAQGVEQWGWDDREASSLISLTAFAVGFQGSCSQKTWIQPLGDMAAVGCQLLSPKLDPLCLWKTLNCSVLCSSRKSLHLRHSSPRQNANSAAGTCHIFQD